MSEDTASLSARGHGRAAKIALAVVVIVTTSPVWGFEVLYRVFLPANRPELAATTDATPIEMNALWLETGERPDTPQDVTPLWALNYFRVYRRGADPRPGVHAVSAVARLWAAQAWPPGARVRRLRRIVAEIAVGVWLSRTATVDALKRALAARRYFGRHAYGIKAAKKAYYGCSASAVTTAQVALLVGLLANPCEYDPIEDPDLVAKRRQYVLKTLALAGLISEPELAKAMAENAESTVVPNATACP